MQEHAKATVEKHRTNAGFVAANLMTDLVLLSGLGGVGSHEIALVLYYVLMMMVSYVLDFLEPPEDGKLILQKWKELKNSRLGTGFVFARLLQQQSTD